MIYAVIKNQTEKGRLDTALRASGDKNWSRRLKIITLSHKQYTVMQLSKMFDLCPATIRGYIRSYNEDGLDALRPRKSTGRPPKIAHWTMKDWNKVLERPPNQYEGLNTHSHRWTLELLGMYLKKYHQLQVSIVSIHNSLRKTGVEWNKQNACKFLSFEKTRGKQTWSKSLDLSHP